MSGFINKAELLSRLPPPWPEDLRPLIRAAVTSRPEHKVVVIDDDPTGTQTVYDVPVLTTWEKETLRAEFNAPGVCFYVLTNSRSLPSVEARALALGLANNLRRAADGRSFTVVSRSDSTLRGHFPLETDTLAEALGPFDGTLLIPYFEAGGRYTVNDTHYVAAGNALVPAAETCAGDGGLLHLAGGSAPQRTATCGQPARDVVPRGRVHSQRRDAGRSRYARGRIGGPAVSLSHRRAVRLRPARTGAAPALAAGVQVRQMGRRRACCRAATWRNRHRWLLCSQDDETARSSGAVRHGRGLDAPGRVVVPRCGSRAGDPGCGFQAGVRISARRRCCPRHQPPHPDRCGRPASFDIGHRVSSALVEIFRRLTVRPRYLIAKGGITSSDLAVKGLGVKRALVRGQLLPGVPVWELGDEAKFPGLPYIVFPGNVGGPDALADAVIQLSTPNSNS